MSDASLFIQLYLDEDVSVLVAQLLRPHGFEVLTTLDAHNLGSSDAAQLRYAASTTGRYSRTIASTTNACMPRDCVISVPTPAFSSRIVAPPTSISPAAS